MKNINLNNNDVLNKLKESFGAAIDKRINENRMNEKLELIDSLSFGELKTLFEGVTDKLIESVNGKKIIARYVKIIQENKYLKNMFLLHEGVMNPYFTKNPELLVNSVCALSESMDNKTSKDTMKKLRGVIKEAVNESKINADTFESILKSTKKEINEAVNYLLTHKRSAKNLYEHTDKMNLVIEHIKNNVKEKNINEDKTYDELLSNLNESVEGLDGWEREVVESIALCELSGKKESELFESYKNECLSLIDEKINESEEISDKSRFTTMKENLTKKMFDENSVTENIITLAELKNTLQLG